MEAWISPRGSVESRLAAKASVFFAGNKEEREEGEYEPPSQPSSGSPYEAAQKHRRFQVYVHSKLMIVDDEVWHLPNPLVNALCLSKV